MEEFAAIIVQQQQAKIIKAKFCHVPLSFVPSTIAQFAKWLRLFIAGRRILVHAFVALEIKFQGGSTLWFSIEKQTYGIVVQQSANLPDVTGRLLGVERKKPVTTLHDDKVLEVGVSLLALFFILFDLKPERNVYHVTKRNCQQFAAGVFEFATGLPAKVVLSPFIA